MVVWTKIPFLRLLLPMLIGIGTGIFIKADAWLIAFALMAIAAFASALFIKNTFRNKTSRSVLLQVSIFCIGFVFINIFKQYWLPNYYAKYVRRDSIIFAKILEPVAEKRKSYKTFAEIIAVKNGEIQTFVTGKIVVYFEKNIQAQQLNYGDVVILKNNIQDLKDAPNPHEFSPKVYLGYRSIYQSCYLHKNDWRKLKIHIGNPLKVYCYKARDYCIQLFRENGLEGDEFAVASAMIVGFEDELKPEIISYFSASGAMHLLSVSGLHIAFVYLILVFILKPLRTFKYGKYIEFVISVIVLWFYAIVTGFSAPVLRSAIMFSLVVYAKSFEKNLNMFNVLALAGFAILVADPLSISDVGFQLSFLALLSILLIQPFVSNLYHTRVWLLQKVWEITSVSISATIGTLPFTFYYFHQFPNYFILVNIVVIPLSTILLYTGFAAIILSWLPFIPFLLIQALKYITRLLNYLLSVDERAPGSIITGIQINEIETIIFFISISFFIIYLYSKNIKHMIYSVVIFILFMCISFLFYVPHLRQNKLVVYCINKHTAIDYFERQNAVLIADNELVNNIIDLRYHVFPNRIRNFVTITKTVALEANYRNKSFSKYKNYLQCGIRKMVIINDSTFIKKHKKKLQVDYLLLTNSFKNKLQDLNDSFDYKVIILDASLNKKSRYKIAKQLKQKKQKFWDVTSDGAFVDSW
jgi:competence protein ComEC